MQHELGITDVTGSGIRGGQEGAASTRGQRFAVAGMTCGHCVASVRQELGALDGVQAVEVQLRPGGDSQVVVHAPRTLTEDEVRAAVEEAGYTLSGA